MDHERDDGRPELEEIDATPSLAPDLTAAFFAALDESERDRAIVAVPGTGVLPRDPDDSRIPEAPGHSVERRLEALLDLTTAFDAFGAHAPGNGESPLLPLDQPVLVQETQESASAAPAAEPPSLAAPLATPLATPLAEPSSLIAPSLIPTASTEAVPDSIEPAPRVEPLALLPPHLPDALDEPLFDDLPRADELPAEGLGVSDGGAGDPMAPGFFAEATPDVVSDVLRDITPDVASSAPLEMAWEAAPEVKVPEVAVLEMVPSVAPAVAVDETPLVAQDVVPDLPADDAAADAPLDLEEFIVFSLADTRCVVPIRNVVEVGRIPAAAPVPHAPAWLHGLGNLRGQVLSLIDLRAFLGLGRIRPSAGRMIVLRADADDVIAGLMVDHVHQIVQLAPSRFQAAPATLAPGYGGFVWGVCEYGLHTMVGLDVDGVLGAEALHGEGALPV